MCLLIPLLESPYEESGVGPCATGRDPATHNSTHTDYCTCCRPRSRMLLGERGVGGSVLAFVSNTHLFLWKITFHFLKVWSTQESLGSFLGGPHHGRDRVDT